MQRRSFLKLSALCAISLLAPITIEANNSKNKTLILIELDGGNDGLNTFVPYSNKKYHELRPTLSLKEEELLILNKDFALNNKLSNVYNLYKEGSVAIINGLGYEKANLSHFKSIQIVESGGNGIKHSSSGWLSEYLRDININEITPANALLIGKRKRGYLFDKDLLVLQIKNINEFINKSKTLSLNKEKTYNESLNFLYKQKENILSASKSFEKHIERKPFSTNSLNEGLKAEFDECLKIIKSKLEIPVIKLSQKGYDTHSNQKQRQSELLEELDKSLGYFVKELKKQNLYDEVLIVTYSEFGRRVKENGSLGTDHGTASVQFALGGLVKGGIYQKHPSLDNLHKNNLIYTTEYNSLYNTVLSNWFNNKQNRFSNYEIINFI